MRKAYILALIILLILTTLPQEVFSSKQRTALDFGRELIGVSLHLSLEENSVEPTLCRKISVETDKENYRIDERILVTVRFIHLRPGCVEIMMLHHHEIRLEILDDDGKIIAEWNWITRKDIVQTVEWKPKKTGAYTVRASSWFNGEKLEVEDMKKIKVTGNIQEIDETSLYLVALTAAAIIAGIVLAYLLARRPNKG